MPEKITVWNESEAQAIREQMRGLLASALFVHAERLGRFLKFVVGETLDGRGHRLNQYAIAMDVFDRDQTFDPTVDAIASASVFRKSLISRAITQECPGPDR